jgi:hypothetical protein
VDVAAALRAGDFFCAAVRLAARTVGFFVGFFLAMMLSLPFPSRKVSINAAS